MNAVNKIPIKNIYYMLCYAFNAHFAIGYNLCGFEEFNNIYNFMSKILIESIKKLRNFGLNKEYDLIEEPLSLINGRINIGQSIDKMSFVKRQLVCNHDILTCDFLLNQIIKATVSLLIKHDGIDKALRQDLYNLYRSLKQVTDIHLSKKVFDDAYKYREDYKIVMNICKLIFEDLIANEDGEDLKFFDFDVDNHLAKLYEKFVLNFFKVNLPGEDYVVHSPKIKWNVDDFSDIELLPEMRTDIVILCKSSNTELIIDTKFYAEIFTKSNFGTKLTYRSENMYQIYTYLNNSSFNGKKIAMLLYPTTDFELDKKHRIQGMDIFVRTLNLGDDWEKIEKRLMDIAQVVN